MSQCVVGVMKKESVCSLSSFSLLNFEFGKDKKKKKCCKKYKKGKRCSSCPMNS